MDGNGNSLEGIYYGRGEANAPYRIDYADGTWQAFWAPANGFELARFLLIRYPRAKVDLAPYLGAGMHANYDHAAGDWIQGLGGGPIEYPEKLKGMLQDK